MLCAFSREQFKLEEPEPPHSPESLATRDFSGSGLSSRTRDWDSKLEDIQVDEAESTLKEALSLNYEARVRKREFDVALSVFQWIDIKGLTPRMSKAIVERTRPRKSQSKDDIVPTSIMSLHSVSLLIEAILLKARSLEELGRYIEVAKECKIILDYVDSALPNGMPEGIAGFLDDAITAYRRALVKLWNLEPERLAGAQKNLAVVLLFGGVKVSLPLEYKVWGPTNPDNSTKEAIFLLLIHMRKFELLADYFEQVLLIIYNRAERWYFLALCYSAAGQNEATLNLLKKVARCSKAKHMPHFPSFLFGAKLGSQDFKLHSFFKIQVLLFSIMSEVSLPKILEHSLMLEIQQRKDLMLVILGKKVLVSNQYFRHVRKNYFIAQLFLTKNLLLNCLILSNYNYLLIKNAFNFSPSE
ncbi:hypothetical protein UlMin_012271 [Ulmus minor]